MPVDPRTAAPRPLTVLLAEDEDGVRAFVRQVLEQAGYAVLPAADADEAERTFRTDPDRVGLLLTDVLMPGRTGPELAAALRAVRPGLRVLFMSGFPGGPGLAPDPLPPDASLLDKPFSIDRLLHAVALAVANHAPYA